MGVYKTQHNRCENRISVAVDPWGFAGAADVNRFLFSIWIYRIIRIILAVVFLWSGAAKLYNPGVFAVIIEAYGLMPDTWIMPVAILIPALEIILAIGLLFDVRGNLGGITGLLVLFMVVLTYGIHMGLDVDCGCFGPEDPEAEAFHGLRSALYRDMGMMAGIGYLYIWRRFQRKTPHGLKHYLSNFYQEGETKNETL